MSLPEHPSQSSLFGVENLLGDGFAPSDPYRLFNQRIYPLLLAGRGVLEQCYCLENGRPGCEPVLLLGLTLLQFMEKLPDRKAMDMLRYHLGWKLALNQELQIAAPDASLLCLFRKRLLEHQQASLLFDTVLQALIEQGLVPRRGARRLDSSAVVGLVAVLSEAEKLREVMRLALQHLQRELSSAPAWMAGLVERYVEHQPDWRMDREAAGRYCQRVGQDLLVMHGFVKREHAQWLAQGPLAILERVLKESFDWQQQQQALVPRNKLKPGSLVNPHEPEAVMTRKRQTRWTGYKVQIGESVPETSSPQGKPTGAFITCIHTQPASEGDIRSLDAIREAEKRVGLETPAERYVDSAYVSGEQLRKELEAGGKLMGPIGRCKVHPAETEGFVIADDGQHATCPAGHANESCLACNKTDRNTRGFRLVWGKCCASCPRRPSCLRAGARERHVETRIDFALLQQRRREQVTAEFQEQMHRRNAIEGTGSELVRAHGLRHARYRGRAKVHLGHLLIAAACNVKRWLRRMQYELTKGLMPSAEAIYTIAV